MPTAVDNLVRRVSIAFALGFGTLTWLVGLAMIIVPAPGSSAAVLDSTDRLGALAPYGNHGSHLVGVRRLTDDDMGPAPDVTVWHPALRPDSPEPAPRPTIGESTGITYPYELKLFGPLGTVALATYQGQAIPAAPIDTAGGPYPLVILSPGFAIGAESYAWLGEHLASHGFVVAAPDHAEHLDPGKLWRTNVERPNDIIAVIDAVDRLAAPGGRFEGLIDTESVAVTGHSAGGLAALAAAGAQMNTNELRDACFVAEATDDPVTFQCDALLPHLDDMAELAGLDAVPVEAWPRVADPRVDAAVVLAGDAVVFGPTGLAEVDIPVLAVGGTADTDSPFAWGTGPAFEQTTGLPRAQLVLEGAEHMLFAGRCESVRLALRLQPTMFCADPAWDRTRGQQIVAAVTTAFLRSRVDGSSEAIAALSEIADPDTDAIDNVELHLLRSHDH